MYVTRPGSKKQLVVKIIYKIKKKNIFLLPVGSYNKLLLIFAI